MPNKKLEALQQLKQLVGSSRINYASAGKSYPKMSAADITSLIERVQSDNNLRQSLVVEQRQRQPRQPRQQQIRQAPRVVRQPRQRINYEQRAEDIQNQIAELTRQYKQVGSERFNEAKARQYLESQGNSNLTIEDLQKRHEKQFQLKNREIKKLKTQLDKTIDKIAEQKKDEKLKIVPGQGGNVDYLQRQFFKSAGSKTNIPGVPLSVASKVLLQEKIVDKIRSKQLKAGKLKQKFITEENKDQYLPIRSSIKDTKDNRDELTKLGYAIRVSDNGFITAYAKKNKVQDESAIPSILDSLLYGNDREGQVAYRHAMRGKLSQQMYRRQEQQAKGDYIKQLEQQLEPQLYETKQKLEEEYKIYKQQGGKEEYKKWLKLMKYKSRQETNIYDTLAKHYKNPTVRRRNQ